LLSLIDIASAQRIIEESGLGSPESVLIGIARSLVNRPFNAPDRAVAVLSNDERDFLLAGGAVGVNSSVDSELMLNHLADVAIEMEALRRRSVLFADAAKLLQVSKPRISQMTAQQALYCFRLDDLAYYPLWQFIDGKILPGMKAVLLGTGGDVHPLSIHRFFNTELAELSLEDVPVTPIQWLKNGGNTDILTQLVAQL